MDVYNVEDPIVHIVEITLDVAVGGVVVMNQEIVDSDTVFGHRYRGIPGTSTPQEWALISEGDPMLNSQSYALVPNSNPELPPTPTYLMGASGVNYYSIQRSADGQT